MKRHIRLREFSPLTTATYIPSSEYLSRRPNMIRHWGYFVEFDGSGYLKTGNHIIGKRKIVFLGGSFYENLYVSQNARIPSILEVLLNSQGYDYEVLNASISGLTLLQAFNVIVNKVASNPPDILIMGDLANEIYPLSHEKIYWNKTRYYSNLTDYNKNNASEVDLKLNNIDVREKILNSIIYFCNEFNIKLIFASICNLQVEDETFFRVNKKDNELRKILYKNTEKVAKEKSIPYINVTDYNEKQYFTNMQDDIHVNSLGAANVADKIHKFILEKYNLKKKSKPIFSEEISDTFVTAPNRSKIVYQVSCVSYSRIVVIFDIKCLSEVNTDYVHVKIFGNYKNGIDILPNVWQQRSVFFDLEKKDNTFPISFRSNNTLELKNINLIFI
ncbi:SGNH/GDSL hydrolase family protein [Psychrobacter sp. TWR1-1-1]|uniref:SGNH/GDSL hydrolase family protein n=1 Tax=Psychrobacter sp. TWR1-1-1 TaxID=2804665 RepID=UPI003CF90560